MSFVQQGKTTKSKKKIQDQGGVIKLVQDLSNRVQRLEQKITERTKPQNVKSLERKILELERKIQTSSVQQAPQTSQSNSREMKILNNVINEDLNKIKIKLEKHEDLIKKMLFN